MPPGPNNHSHPISWNPVCLFVSTFIPNFCVVSGPVHSSSESKRCQKIGMFIVRWTVLELWRWAQTTLYETLRPGGARYLTVSRNPSFIHHRCYWPP